MLLLAQERRSLNPIINSSKKIFGIAIAGNSSAKVKEGIQSIRRLEEAGIDSLKDLVKLQVDDLVELGIRRGLATQIRGHMKRRMQ